MGDRFLAFRMFGAFAWPPIPDKQPQGDARKGAVEIFFVRRSSRSEWFDACIRWTPLSKFARTQGESDAIDWVTSTEPWPNENVYLDNLDLNSVVGDGNHPFFLRISEQKKKAGVKLHFVGGDIFEQFALKERLDTTPGASRTAHKLMLRVPLVRTATQVLLTGVVIGEAEKPGFRFQLALPTPIPLGEVGRTGGDNGVFAFASIYSRKPKVGDYLSIKESELQNIKGAALAFDMLEAGPPNQTRKAEGGTDIKLGCFLFSKRRLAPNEIYRSYKGSPLFNESKWNSLWLEPNSSRPIEKLMARLFTQMGLVANDHTCSGFLHVGDFNEYMHAFPDSFGLWSDDQGDDTVPAFRIATRITTTVELNFTSKPSPDDDVRLKNGILEIKIGGGDDGWSRIGSQKEWPIWVQRGNSPTIVADLVGQLPCVLIYGKADDNGIAVASDLYSPPALRLETRFVWKATGIETLEFIGKGLEERFRRALAGVKELEGGQPAALLPDLKVVSGETILSLLMRKDSQEAISGGSSVFKPDTRLAEDDGNLRAVRRYRGGFLPSAPVLGLEQGEPGLAKDTGRPLSIKMAFPLFERSQTQNATEVDFNILPHPDPKETQGDSQDLLFTAALQAKDPKPFTLASIGGLALENAVLSNQLDNDHVFSELRAIKPATLSDPADLELKLRFDAGAVIPIGLDVPRGPRRPSPIMLDETGAAQDPGNLVRPFMLVAKETLSATMDREFSADLHEKTETRGRSGSFILISEQPFAVKRAIADPLDLRGGDEGTVVARYSSIDRAWRALAKENAYRFMLPPQAIGESMDKPNRLELEDAQISKVSGFDSPLPETADSAAYSEAARRAVEFRLTPPAELWIRPSDVPRRFVLPEWAAGDLFEQKGELGLGVALVGLRAEFVYGVSVTIDPSKESGVNSRARVTELGALMGRPVDAERGSQRWGALRKAYDTRPERLELWSGDPTSTIPFAPARFSTGSRFALRHTALHRHPVIDAVPIQVHADNNVMIPPPIEQAAAGRPRFHPHGLSGGALWPIESANALEMIAREPQSSGGAIEKIALSPLGGDADQVARFAGNRAAIITETRGGYVQRQQVEIIGRIGVFWHRAKHVIVYERTVNPSAQFAPEREGKLRTRRPVLRKVQEYIEFLQMERRYPDIEGAGAHTNAFLKGVRCNSRIIPVDSAWAEEVGAEDVGNVGYLIPLWNRHAARMRPQVYKRPDIAFLMQAEGAGENPECPQECTNPENIYFFADTSPGLTDDTDRWVKRKGIDGVNLPAPRHNWSGAPDGKPVNNDSRICLTPKGFSRFTWRLAQPPARTAINAGRGNAPVYASFESVTFSRFTAAELIEGEKNSLDWSQSKLAAEFKPKWELSNGEKFGIDSIWQRGKEVAGPPVLNALSTPLAAMMSVLSSQMPTDEDEQKSIKKAFEGLKKFLEPGNSKKNIDDLIVARSEKLKSIILDIESISPAILERNCDDIKKNFEAKINARKLAIAQELRAWEAEIDSVLAGPANAAEQLAEKFKNETGLKQFLKVEITAFIAPLLLGGTAEVGKLQHGIETARSIATGAVAMVEESLDRLRGELNAAWGAIEDGKPWSQDRISRFRERLSEAFVKARTRMLDVASDSQRRLATELDAMSQGIAGATAQALSFIEVLDNKVGDADRAFAKWVGTLAAYRKKYEQLLAPDAKEKIQKVRTKVSEAKDKPKYSVVYQKAESFLNKLDRFIQDDVKNALDAFMRGLNELRPDLIAGVRGPLDELAAFAKKGSQEIQDVLDEIKSVPDEVGDTLKSELSQKFEELRIEIGKIVDEALAPLLQAAGELDRWADVMLKEALEAVDELNVIVRVGADLAYGHIDEVAAQANGMVEDALRKLAPDELSASITDALLALPAITAALGVATRAAVAAQTGSDLLAAVRFQLHILADRIDDQLSELAHVVSQNTDYLIEACKLVRQPLEDAIADLTRVFDNSVQEVLNTVPNLLANAFDSAEEYRKLYDALQKVDSDIRRVGNDMAATAKRMEAWGDRALAAIGDIDKGGVASVPNNILKALAAIGSGPELPNLDFARDRMAYYYGLVNDVVDTTPAEAWFGRLGDGLKALGISMPFKQIGDRILPDDLQNIDIGRILGNFAGIDLSRFFRGIKMPPGAEQGLRLTHDFDRRTFRAWAQIDVNIEKSGRNSLFAIGPFTLDMVDAKLQGFLKLEASKDTDSVEEAGKASITTDLAAVVGGQTMVTLRQVKLSYAKAGGLEVDFDPKNIKLNPTLQFIENTLKNVFPDEVGGLEVVKNNGVPVGLRHAFTLPPLSLMFGTSGVQNIQISNLFELLAYPDFVIANRFTLARQELPFIFTVFIIGGTGWLTVDVEYRPFEGDSGLLVVVEAGAGGSASIGFAFAGVTGSIFITISVALTYRKLIGKSGGGLTVSLVVLITGLVDVLRIAHAVITVMLRLAYQENGDIDATGTFRVTIRISRFFKISAGGQARYRMTGGKKETSSSTSVDYEVTDKNLKKAEKLLRKA